MRLTNIYTWTPDDAEAVYKRFEAFSQGDAPKEVKDAFANLKVIAWEKLASNTVVQVIEGDEVALHTWIAYWDDLGESAATPCWDLTNKELLDKLTPPPFISK